VVAIIISAVMIKGSGAKSQAGGSKPSATSGANSAQPAQSASSSSSDSTAGALPGTTDAATLTLAGGAQKSTQWSGAKASGGEYVDHMTSVGASVTWTVTAPKAASYDLWVRYANAQKDAASATTVVNGKALGWKMDLKNYGKEGDWTGWYRTFVSVNLNKGSNTVAVTCASGDSCHFNLDQLALVEAGGAKPNW
jgi:hypothetical protein